MPLNIWLKMGDDLQRDVAAHAATSEAQQAQHGQVTSLAIDIGQKGAQQRGNASQQCRAGDHPEDQGQDAIDGAHIVDLLQLA
ncbi:hypothetical protein G6F58_013628 [Rhizopus delemar]|nr:hypothetical protein G6F58_013628 [Rhizopus delemar]